MSGWVSPTLPNIADYTTFLQNAGFTPAVLPTDSPWITYAFNQAVSLCNDYGASGYSQCFSPTVTNALYPIAVYNLAAHIQILITPDQTASVVGAISDGTGNNPGNIFVVTAVNNGTIAPGFLLQGLTAYALQILSFGTGTGGIGNYTLGSVPSAGQTAIAPVSLLIASSTVSLVGTFFSGLRAQFNVLSFVAGVISESHDESTGQSIAVSDALTNLSLRDLNYLTTPFGRAYMQYAADFGELVGIS